MSTKLHTSGGQKKKRKNTSTNTKAVGTGIFWIYIPFFTAYRCENRSKESLFRIIALQKRERKSVNQKLIAILLVDPATIEDRIVNVSPVRGNCPLVPCKNWNRNYRVHQVNGLREA